MSLNRYKIALSKNQNCLRLMSSSPNGKQSSNSKVQTPLEEAKKNLVEAESYEKWLNSKQKDALFKLDHFKQALSKWRNKGQASTEVWYAERVGPILKQYENFVGLTDVKAAQALVIKEEQLFVDAQDRRRDAQNSINEIQAKLKAVRSELERTPRGDDRYLELVTEEHTIIKQENSVVNGLQNLERLERDKFSRLSTAVRNSHEKERAQAEKMKYWSLIISMLAALTSILGSAMVNRMRMKELRQIVTDSTKSNAGSDKQTDPGLLPILDDQHRQLDSLSKTLMEALQALDGRLNDLSQSLEKIPVERVINVQAPDVELGKDFRILRKDLSRDINNHVETIKKIISLRDDNLVADLKSSNSDAYNSFSSRVCDIEEKVTDIRSLVLDQIMSSSNSLITSSVKNHEAAKAAERSSQSVIGSFEVAMSKHEERMTQQMIATGLIVAVIVPVVSYSISKLF